jgi:transposase
MAKKLFTDELWEVIEPLLPEEPPKPKGGTGPASMTGRRPSPAYCSS